jgi:hypothetical protein
MHYKVQIIDIETKVPRYGWITSDRKKAYTFLNGVQQILNPDWYVADIDMIIDRPVNPCDNCCRYPCSIQSERICNIKRKSRANPMGFAREYKKFMEEENGTTT